MMTQAHISMPHGAPSRAVGLRALPGLLLLSRL
jgi:hypothetical protein